MTDRSHHMHEHAHHEHHAPTHESHHEHHDGGNINAMARSATLHCLTGCAIGEIMGMLIGTYYGFGTLETIVTAIALAFVFGYTLSTLPLLKAGLGIGKALSIVVVADTLSIATMEVVDNLVMAVTPGAMSAGLLNSMFWMTMPLALAVAYFAAVPVNRYLIQRGQGHALTHEYHHGTTTASDWRRLIPVLSTATLIAAIVAFLLGGLVVSLTYETHPMYTSIGGHTE